MRKNIVWAVGSDYDTNYIKNKHTRRIPCIHSRYLEEEEEEEEAEVTATCIGNKEATGVRDWTAIPTTPQQHFVSLSNSEIFHTR